jgi:hypothetical protein
MKRAQMGPAELEKLYQIYQPSLLGELSAMAAVPPIPCPSFRPHLRRDWAHPCPHLRQDWAHPRPHLRRDGAHPRPHLHWNRASCLRTRTPQACESARTHRPERRSLQAHMARRMKFFNIIEKMPKDGCSASGGGGDGVQQARTLSGCRCRQGEPCRCGSCGQG